VSGYLAGYLTNLARRGAGLAPEMAPRAEVSPVISLSDRAPFSDSDQGGLETFPVSPVSEKASAPSGSLEPAMGAVLPARPHPPALSAEEREEKGRPAEFEVRPREHFPENLHQSTPAPREQESSPELPISPRVTQRVTPEPERPFLAAAPVPAPPAPRPEPSQVTVPVLLPESVPSTETLSPPKAENPALPIPQAALALPSPRNPEPALPPRPRAEPVATEPPEPAEPRIEVRIGRVELRAAPPPAQPPAPSRERRGFEDHALARRYLRRKWY
jgi:hypothetical protein